MKHLLMVLVVALAFVSIDCGAPLSESYSARKRRYKQISGMQMRMLTEDFDELMLFERNTYLTQWDPRVGLR